MIHQILHRVSMTTGFPVFSAKMSIRLWLAFKHTSVSAFIRGKPSLSPRKSMLFANHAVKSGSFTPRYLWSIYVGLFNANGIDMSPIIVILSGVGLVVAL